MIEADFEFSTVSFRLHGLMRDEGLISLQGANGAGKTTFLLSIAGMHRVKGSIRLNGVEVSTLPMNMRAAIYIDQRTHFPQMDVQRHLAFGGGSGTDVRRVREMLGISFDGPVSSLSLGQKIRLSIATAALARPRLLMLDEVLQNISGREQFILNLKQLSLDWQFDIIAAAQETDGIADDHKYSIVNGTMQRLY